MIKKNLIITTCSIASLIVIYFIIFIVQNSTLEHSLVKNYNEGDQVSDYKNKLAFIRCNSNILDPEFATIFFIKNEGNMGFYKPKKIFMGSYNDWGTSYTGGATIKKATFFELVKMAKEDCNQFKSAKGNPSDETINWYYSPYTLESLQFEEPELTDEEVEIKRQETLEYLKKIKEVKNKQ